MSNPPPGTPDEHSEDKHAVPPRQSAPHAGRVGTQGARAERPAETKRKPPSELQSGRGAKAPSAEDEAEDNAKAP